MTARILLPVSAGCALEILALGAAVRLRAPAAWFALALVGQAAALQLIDAGNLLRYQHYRPWGRLLTETGPVLLAIVGIQATLVAAGLLSRWSTIRGWCSSSFRIRQLLGIAVVFGVSGAAAQRDAGLYVQDLVLATLIQAVSLGNIVLLAWSFPASALDSISRVFNGVLGRREGSAVGRRVPVDRVAKLAAVWVVVLSSALALFSYQLYPHITDEVTYLYQARFLAHGSLTLPAPPVPEAFDLYLMEETGGQWYPVTPPGWPVILAVGVALGVPGLVNPLLAGLNVLLSFLLIGELYGRRVARAVVLLLAVSPWYVFMAMSFMTHTFYLTCALGAAVAVAQARRTERTCWAWLAGAAVGMASLIRPMDGLIVGGLIGLWSVGVGGRRLKPTSLLAFGLGATLVGGLVLPYNASLTGNPMVFPINAYLDNRYGPGTNDLGFGPNRGFNWPLQPFPGHSPLGAAVNVDLNVFSLNTELFGWSIGSLLFVAIMLLSGRLRRSDYLMIAICLAVFWPYFFYYYSGGPDFGARYWYLMIVPMVALTVRGIQHVKEKLVSVPGGSPVIGVRLLAAVFALCALTLINYFPWRVADKYHNFWNMRPDVTLLAKEYGFGRSLVLIRGRDSHPDYASAAIRNPLDWNADEPIYAWDRGQSVRERLVRAFPDRTVWIVDSPSISGAGYRVAAGPIRPGESVASGLIELTH